MISRFSYANEIRECLEQFPVTALLGPRQCGKTTLSRMVAIDREATFFDLEDPTDMARLNAPKTTLERLRGLIVIDEIQHKPDLFPLLRVLADRTDIPARFLILGSASPHLMRGVSESLAGRVGFVDLSGFDATEVGWDRMETLWLRGGCPKSFLAANDAASFRWRENFIRTFLTQDIPQLGITVPAAQLRRFWTMLSHYHGQIWNASAIGSSMGMSYKTIQGYLDILAGAYMARVLQPWTENVGKRIRKAPKIYLRDSGLFHSLQGIADLHALQGHPKLGASWEGFAVEQLLRVLHVTPDEAFFWATHAGAELDLLLFIGGKRYGFEVKYADAPSRTKSMNSAVDTLGLERLFVLYPGEEDYVLNQTTEVVALRHVEKLAARLRRRGPSSFISAY